MDPTDLGQHQSGGGDKYGIAYTCSGGFIDLAHLRDMVDLTEFYYKHLTCNGRNKAGNFVPASDQYPGSAAQLNADVPDSPVTLRIDVARSMAYTESVFHEIETYWAKRPGGHHSSFSPEDLSSNFLGTYVAGLALQDRREFTTAVTAHLNDLMDALHPVSPIATAANFEAIDTKWVTSIQNPVSKLFSSYLKRRNFNISPINPCLIDGASGCFSSSPFPPNIPTSFSPDILGRYEMTFVVPISGREQLGFWLKKSEFGPKVDAIKADAHNVYGNDFEKCQP